MGQISELLGSSPSVFQALLSLFSRYRVRLHVEIMRERTFFLHVSCTGCQLRTVHYSRRRHLGCLNEDLSDGVRRAVVEMSIE